MQVEYMIPNAVRTLHLTLFFRLFYALDKKDYNNKATKSECMHASAFSRQAYSNTFEIDIHLYKCVIINEVNMNINCKP